MMRDVVAFVWAVHIPKTPRHNGPCKMTLGKYLLSPKAWYFALIWLRFTISLSLQEVAMSGYKMAGFMTAVIAVYFVQ
jgi:hypothetical protein